MKLRKEDIPVIMQSPGTIMRAQPNFGDMTVVYHELPKGTDFTPLLKGLDNDSCHCPHWGYIFQGTFRVTIQHILPRSATLGLTHFHEIWMLTLKKQRQCLRGRHTLLTTR